MNPNLIALIAEDKAADDAPARKAGRRKKRRPKPVTEIKGFAVPVERNYTSLRFRRQRSGGR
jgi:hypothetical protein